MTALSVAISIASCATDTSTSPPIAATRSSSELPGAISPRGEAVFESTRYGYRLAYPNGWRVEAVPGVGGVHPGEPGVDTFNDDSGHILSIVGESASVLAGWICAINRHLADEHDLVAESVEEVSVAGVPARLSSYHLVIKPYVIHYLSVEVVRDGRGLTLSLESTTNDDEEDRVLLESLLASLELTGER